MLYDFSDQPTTIFDMCVQQLGWAQECHIAAMESPAGSADRVLGLSERNRIQHDTHHMLELYCRCAAQIVSVKP